MLFDCFISDLKLNLALLDCFSPLLIDIFILIISFNALILINKLIIETIQDIIEAISAHCVKFIFAHSFQKSFLTIISLIPHILYEYEAKY